jgi:thiamine biosynthesis lipoprotein
VNKLKRMRPLLGTYVEIGAQSAQSELASAIDAAFEAIQEVQSLLSFHDAGSDLSRLNAAHGEEVILRPLSLRMMRLAKAMTRVSGGRFNCTVGGALVRKGVLPDHGIKNYLDSGNAGDIELRGNKVRLCRPVLLTLDGIAKGYAVDCAIKVLQRHGVAAGWVNAGGDLRVYGDLVLPVQRREMNGEFSALGGLRNAAMATSCVRETPDVDFPAWIVGDLHVPASGVWSVLARTAWRADALAKVAGVASENEREALIRDLGGKLIEGMTA